MRELGKNGSQPDDCTQHLKTPHDDAAMKPKPFGGCNMRPRLLPVHPRKKVRTGHANGYIPSFRKP